MSVSEATGPDVSRGLRPEVTPVPYHHLAKDIDGEGFWSRVDRLARRISDRLNPILIKEARQSLGSPQFLITFFMLLFATIGWTVLGIVFLSPRIYYLPAGATMILGYYLLMAIPIGVFVPIVAFRSLGSELDGDTFELLSVTDLTSRQIAWGKFASSMLQTGLYFAAVTPSIAFCYLLQGLTLGDIAMTIGIVAVSGATLTAIALMLAPLMPGFLGQAISLLVLIGFVTITQFTLFSVVAYGVLDSDASTTMVGWVVFSMVSLVALSFVVLSLMIAAAKIAPVTENRSTPIRLWVLVQTATWIVGMTVIVLTFNSGEDEGFSIFIWILAAYWLLVGTVLLSETRELSPRVRRQLPSTFATRMLLSPLMPGPSSGYLFAICTGGVSVLLWGWWASTISDESFGYVDPVLVAAMMVGYLLLYLGTVRLLTLPLARRRPLPLPAALMTLVVVLIGFAVLPSVITVVLTSSLPQNYSTLEVVDWMWTTTELFSTSSFSPMYVFSLWCLAFVVTVLNLPFLVDVFAYRRVAVPERVRRWQAAQNESEASAADAS